MIIVRQKEIQNSSRWTQVNVIIIIIIIFICSDQCKHRYHEQEIPEVIPIEGIPF